MHHLSNVRSEVESPAVAFRLLDFPSLVVYSEEAVKHASQGEHEKWFERQMGPVELTDSSREGKRSDERKALRAVAVGKGKSTLFRMPSRQLSEALTRVPLYAMLVDVSGSGPDGTKLAGSTSVDVSCFVKDVVVPSRDSKRGYRRGVFIFSDFLGREVGQMELILRLSCLGDSLAPHLCQLPPGFKPPRKWERLGVNLPAQEMARPQKLDQSIVDLEAKIAQHEEVMRSEDRKWLQPDAFSQDDGSFGTIGGAHGTDYQPPPLQYGHKAVMSRDATEITVTAGKEGKVHSLLSSPKTGAPQYTSVQDMGSAWAQTSLRRDADVDSEATLSELSESAAANYTPHNRHHRTPAREARERRSKHHYDTEAEKGNGSSFLVDRSSVLDEMYREEVYSPRQHVVLERRQRSHRQYEPSLSVALEEEEREERRLRNSQGDGSRGLGNEIEESLAQFFSVLHQSNLPDQEAELWRKRAAELVALTMRNQEEEEERRQRQQQTKSSVTNKLPSGKSGSRSARGPSSSRVAVDPQPWRSAGPLSSTLDTSMDRSGVYRRNPPPPRPKSRPSSRNGTSALSARKRSVEYDMNGRRIRRSGSARRQSESARESPRTNVSSSFSAAEHISRSGRPKARMSPASYKSMLNDLYERVSRAEDRSGSESDDSRCNTSYSAPDEGSEVVPTTVLDALASELAYLRSPEYARTLLSTKGTRKAKGEGRHRNNIDSTKLSPSKSIGSEVEEEEEKEKDVVPTVPKVVVSDSSGGVAADGKLTTEKKEKESPKRPVFKQRQPGQGRHTTVTPSSRSKTTVKRGDGRLHPSRNNSKSNQAVEEKDSHLRPSPKSGKGGKEAAKPDVKPVEVVSKPSEHQTSPSPTHTTPNTEKNVESSPTITTPPLQSSSSEKKATSDNIEEAKAPSPKPIPATTPVAAVQAIKPVSSTLSSVSLEKTAKENSTHLEEKREAAASNNTPKGEPVVAKTETTTLATESKSVTVEVVERPTGAAVVLAGTSKVSEEKKEPLMTPPETESVESSIGVSSDESSNAPKTRVIKRGTLPRRLSARSSMTGGGFHFTDTFKDASSTPSTPSSSVVPSVVPSNIQPILPSPSSDVGSARTSGGFSSGGGGGGDSHAEESKQSIVKSTSNTSVTVTPSSNTVTAVTKSDSSQSLSSRGSARGLTPLLSTSRASVSGTSALPATTDKKPVTIESPTDKYEDDFHDISSDSDDEVII